MKYIIALFILLSSCTSKIKELENTEYRYQISNSTNNNIDSLELSQEMDYFQPKIKWTFWSAENNKSYKFQETKNYEHNNDYLRLSLPIGLYLDYTELLPPPQVNFPIKIGDSNFVKFELMSRSKPSKIIRDNELTGYYLVKDTIIYDDTGKFNEKCFVIEAYNFKFKNYKLTYYYSEKLGFLYFKYDFNKEHNSFEIKLNTIYEHFYE